MLKTILFVIEGITVMPRPVQPIRSAAHVAYVELWW